MLGVYYYLVKMNKLNIERQAQVIKVLCEGNSIRSTARINGIAINTVVKLLRDVGAACLAYQYQNMRNLPCKKLQVEVEFNHGWCGHVSVMQAP